MSWTDKRAEYEALAHSLDSSIVLATKDAWPWKVVAFMLMVVTFGGIKRKRFLEDYATTIGPLQAYPRAWPSLPESLLVHEARHTRQCSWFGWAVPVLGWIPRTRAWAGLPLFGLCYLILPLPIGFAWFRWRFELDAERAALRYRLGKGEPLDRLQTRALEFGDRVCGPDYGWSWVISGRKAFQKMADQLSTKE